MSSAELVVLSIVAAALAAAAIAGARTHRRPVSVLTAPRQIPYDIFAGEHPAAAEPAPVRWLGMALPLLILGYFLFDHAFAWLHLPGTPVFVGEMVLMLGIFAIASSHVSVASAIRNSPSLKAQAAYMAWGAILLALALPIWGIDAVRDSAIWYYGIAALLVVFLVISDPGRVGRWTGWFARSIPVIAVWLPLAVLLRGGTPLDAITIPDSRVSILAHRSGNIAVVAAIVIAFLWMVDAERGRFNAQQRIVLTSLSGAAILIAGFQNRGGLVAGICAMAVMLVLLRRRRTELALIILGLVVVAVSVLFATGISVSLSGGREISAEQLVENLVSIINPDEGDARQTSTTEWRLEIWTQVLDDVTNEVPITGFGPGPNLGERYDVATDPENPLRNPHNSHIGVLARMGFVGAAIWIVVWTVWALEMAAHRAWLRRHGLGKEHGLAGWVVVSAAAILVNAIFDPTIEGPQVGLVLWTIFGLGAALPLLHLPVLAARRTTRAVTVVDAV